MYLYMLSREWGRMVEEFTVTSIRTYVISAHLHYGFMSLTLAQDRFDAT